MTWHDIAYVHDVMRDTRIYPGVFIDLLQEPIRQGCNQEIFNLLGRKTLGENVKASVHFDVDRFRAIAANEGDAALAWQKTYHRMPEAAVSYLRSCLPASAAAVLAFEMPPWLSRACDEWRLPFLDIRASPLRFGRDLYIALQTNDLELRQRLSRYAVSVEELRLEAALIAASVRLHQARLQESRRYSFNLEGCLVYVGQSPHDASLLNHDGRALRCNDFAFELRKLSENRRLVHKPHPYAADFAEEERTPSCGGGSLCF